MTDIGQVATIARAMGLNSTSFRPGNKTAVGRPIGSTRAVAVLPYLNRMYREVEPVEWAEIIRKWANFIKLEPDGEVILARDQIRATEVLGKLMLPQEPAMFQQVYAPSVSADEQRGNVAELRQIKAEMLIELEEIAKLQKLLPPPENASS